jgi:general L-amino acid transport system permease protein
VTDQLPPPVTDDDIPFYRDERVLQAAAQVISVVLIVGFLVWATFNFFRAAEARSLELSFNFLKDPAGFPINDPAIDYDPSKSFGYAFYVGILNTLRVSLIGVLAATVLGTVVALMRLSSNWLVSQIALAFIEFHRNIPLLVLLFLWYFTVFNRMPAVEDSLIWPGPVIFNRRGVYMAWPRLTETGMVFAIAAVLGVILAILAFRLLRKRRELTGQQTYYVLSSLAILIVFPLAGWFLSGGDPLMMDIPSLSGFNYSGGMRITPEFAALLVGLTTFTAGFIAEIVRAGIQAVQKGQTEAAKALGLSPSQTLSLVVMPQATRIIIPPMISQYLNLAKNSSLALAIGFMDLFSVGKVTINHAGRAVPVFLLVMSAYLAISLITSAILNFYNRRVQFATR